MQIRAVGPVNMEFLGGTLDNYHLEIFNNSDSVVPITFKVFSVENIPATIIGETTATVGPKTHIYLTLSTLNTHHTMVQVEYPVNFGILLTLYGRDRNFLAIPGVIFYDKDFNELQNSIG